MYLFSYVMNSCLFQNVFMYMYNHKRRLMFDIVIVLFLNNCLLFDVLNKTLLNLSDVVVLLPVYVILKTNVKYSLKTFN